MTPAEVDLLIQLGLAAAQLIEKAVQAIAGSTNLTTEQKAQALAKLGVVMDETNAKVQAVSFRTTP